MVEGLERFREHFKDFPDSYVIIGGTALQQQVAQANFQPRTTTDIDIVLIIEALKPEFGERFWEFIKDGEYNNQEIGEKEEKVHYRFTDPQADGFPSQLELFSRTPKLTTALKQNSHLTPIPIAEDVSSLSAILMDDDYYGFTIGHSTVLNDLRHTNIEALICLKARAYLDKIERKKNGAEGEGRKIKKHKLDVFRLGALLSTETKHMLPEKLERDLQEFIEAVSTDLPDSVIYKEMGMGKLSSKAVLETLTTVFIQPKSDEVGNAE